MKKVLIGICGGIASYKSITIISTLVQEGYEVEVVLSDSAQHFVSKVVIEALTKKKVHHDLFSEPLAHTNLAHWADLVVVVPSTYNIVGKVASGIADDLISTIISASEAQVIFALAMNSNMYNNPILKNNIEKLSQLGYLFIKADEGFLACRKFGQGRLMAESEILKIIRNFFATKQAQEGSIKQLPNKNVNLSQHYYSSAYSNVLLSSEDIYKNFQSKAFVTNDHDEKIKVDFLKDEIKVNLNLSSKDNIIKEDNSNISYDKIGVDFTNVNDASSKHSQQKLIANVIEYEDISEDICGKNIIITAGRTIEYIDPVRYISSPSSGKMGWCLALECKQRGANVSLIVGENNLPVIDGITIINVVSAQDMYNEVVKIYDSADIVIATAAVSDYRVKAQSGNKIKKDVKKQSITLELVENVDIIKELGKEKGEKILVGFCLETENLEKNALKKLKSKNLDFIVANYSSNLSSNSGDFYIINNKKTVVYRNISKVNMAENIVNNIVNIIHNKEIK